MTYLIIGLLIFLVTHSVRILADDWRSLQINRIGVLPWKLVYGLVSGIGFGLIVWGFATSRPDSAMVWLPPLWTRQAAAVITVPAFILIVAAYIPRNRIRTAARHPMVLGVALWALSHLIVNGRSTDVILFGSFFVWAVLDYASAVQRDKKASVVYPVGTLLSTALTVAIGLVAWWLFATVLHQKLIGTQPFG